MGQSLADSGEGQKARIDELCSCPVFLGVMPGLVPGIHVLSREEKEAWMAGTSPAMTTRMDSGTRQGLMA
jgi:hypothetical protein